MAQWRAYSGSSDIQNTVLLTSQCRYQFPATKHSFELTPSSLLRLGDFNVTDLRSVCEGQKNQNMPAIAPLHPWEWPSSPWERVHIAFAGPFLDRMFFFVLVDAHSKFLHCTHTVLESLDESFR
jgi:hypothetical protein